MAGLIGPRHAEAPSEHVEHPGPTSSPSWPAAYTEPRSAGGATRAVDVELGAVARTPQARPRAGQAVGVGLEPVRTCGCGSRWPCSRWPMRRRTAPRSSPSSSSAATATMAPRRTARTRAAGRLAGSVRPRARRRVGANGRLWKTSSSARSIGPTYRGARPRPRRTGAAGAQRRRRLGPPRRRPPRRRSRGALAQRRRLFHEVLPDGRTEAEGSFHAVHPAGGIDGGEGAFGARGVVDQPISGDEQAAEGLHREAAGVTGVVGLELVGEVDLVDELVHALLVGGQDDEVAGLVEGVGDALGLPGDRRARCDGRRPSPPGRRRPGSMSSSRRASSMSAPVPTSSAAASSSRSTSSQS